MTGVVVVPHFITGYRKVFGSQRFKFLFLQFNEWSSRKANFVVHSTSDFLYTKKIKQKWFLCLVWISAHLYSPCSIDRRWADSTHSSCSILKFKIVIVRFAIRKAFEVLPQQFFSLRNKQRFRFVCEKETLLWLIWLCSSAYIVFLFLCLFPQLCPLGSASPPLGWCLLPGVIWPPRGGGNRFIRLFNPH